ncbi:MAG: PAS domain-containing sensor histidine kinase [Bacteroidetes bacterium]|nr:PAS domain-containing sensor histidine kinase [Bacteroidota bacterium]
MKEQIKESEELYKTLVNSLPNPILIHIDGKVVFANNVVLEFTGYCKDDITGQDLKTLFTDPVDHQGSTSFYQRLTDPKIAEEEIEIRTESQKVVLKTFLLRNTPIKYKGEDAIMSILFDYTERKKIEKYILGKVIEAEEKERKRFAADLHDDLGPILSLVKIHLGLLENPKNPEDFKNDLKKCKSLVNESIGKMRIIANNLMPRLIENYGIQAAVNSFISTVQQKDTFTVEFESNLNDLRFSRQVELHIYRIICELINNTIKHSGATKAAVKIRYSGNLLKLAYMDNGKGYNVKEIHKKGTGMGIDNIFQRVNLLNGQVTFSKKGSNTEVRITKEIGPADHETVTRDA